jgi:hypothetical protein
MTVSLLHHGKGHDLIACEMFPAEIGSGTSMTPQSGRGHAPLAKDQ